MTGAFEAQSAWICCADSATAQWPAAAFDYVCKFVDRKGSHQTVNSHRKAAPRIQCSFLCQISL